MIPDHFKLISREELQLRYGLTAAQLAMMMEAPAAEACPHIVLGKRGVSFHLPSFHAWFVAKFGRGVWTEVAP